MKKWILLFLCLQLFKLADAQEPGHNMVRAGSSTAKQVSFLPMVFKHESPYALTGDGRISGQLNNKPLFESAIKKGKLHGSWQSWYQNGLACDSGNFHQGLPDGVWKHWDTQGHLLAVRTYSAERYQRISLAMLRYHPKRTSYPLAALYSKNRKSALHFMTASASFPGSGEVTGLTLEEMVADNVTGNIYRPVFNRSLQHGLFMNFSPDGAVKDSGFYQNGLPHGIWIHVNEKGETAKGTYHHGIKVKEWRVFAASGKIKELTIYSDAGRIKKRKVF